MKACDESLPGLINVHDPDNKNTFVSLYFDGREEHFISHREKVIHCLLTPEEAKNLKKPWRRYKHI